eukprot:TRINITY_DN41324_c0_g1_i1.p1 TRINITY_DN41324_c0_g1~~TRINITY_DN41324_c0_g1_i1.p1  ORF type:complete len:154 (-),score=34.03 TRINITY_DN41324_c0_g1_i1:225-686(-)
MIRRPPRSTLSSSSAASDVYKRQGFYEYMERGLFERWMCFGVVARLSEQAGDPSASLSAQGFAFSLSVGGKLRLMLCPALRELLRDVGGCEVAADMLTDVTHAQMVERGAESMCAGENEGLLWCSPEQMGNPRSVNGRILPREATHANGTLRS